MVAGEGFFARVGATVDGELVPVAVLFSAEFAHVFFPVWKRMMKLLKNLVGSEIMEGQNCTVSATFFGSNSMSVEPMGFKDFFAGVDFIAVFAWILFPTCNKKQYTIN